MSNKRTITKEKLENIFKKLIEKLTDEKVGDIVIENDLYRFVPTDVWSSYEKNVILEGSLFDDIDSLELLLADSKRFCTYVDFDRIASVLRAISEKLAPVDENGENS